MHLRLQERSAFEHLVQDLAIGMVQAGAQQRQGVAVMIGRAGHRVAILQRLAAGMAGHAGAKLGGFKRQISGQAERCQSFCQRQVRGLGPGDMRGTGAMAGFAAHTDFCKLRTVGSCCGVIIPGVPRGVAFGATPFPAFVGAGPVQPVARRGKLVRKDRVPALGHNIPGDVKGLGPARLGREQILLQRIDAADADHLEGAALAAAVFGFDHEFRAVAKEARGDAMMRKGDIAEVAQHRGLVRQRPGLCMVRRCPVRRHVGMAIAADGASDIGRHILRQAGVGKDQQDSESPGKSAQHRASALPYSQPAARFHRKSSSQPDNKDQNPAKLSGGTGAFLAGILRPAPLCNRAAAP